MPADLLVSGRVATLAGGEGFSWVEAIAIEGGRVVAAGRRADLDVLAGPRTRRLDLAPDEVALPGLTDAHLHLVDAALAADQVQLATAASLDEGLRRIRDAHGMLRDPGTWLQGGGWDPARWGTWPSADDLERAAPGRHALFWSHDHHAIWVSHAVLSRADIDATTPDPPGGVIRRFADGRPTGALLETAAALVMLAVPQPSAESLERAILAATRRLVSLGVIAAHDPGELIPDPDLSRGFAAYARLADQGRLALKVHASIRHQSLTTALERGLRSGESLGEDPAGRARMGWLKLFADGALGSRTAALLEPYEDDPVRGDPPAGPFGIFSTDPFELGRLVDDACGAGITGQIHAIGDAAVRAALDALEPTTGRTALMPRLEHVQLLHPDDAVRFAELGVAASVQPAHLRSDAEAARRAWGERAERDGYPYGRLAEAGAVLAFGSDAPVEPDDPWPGIEVAVTRRDPSWPADETFGPTQRLALAQALRAQCIGPALLESATDRGRLSAGQQADLVVVPAGALGEPVEPGGALGLARPRLVLVDGEVAFEA